MHRYLLQIYEFQPDLVIIQIGSNGIGEVQSQVNNVHFEIELIFFNFKIIGCTTFASRFSFSSKSCCSHTWTDLHVTTL